MPDLASAQRVLDGDGAIGALIERRCRQWGPHLDAEASSLFARGGAAVKLAYARLAVRHGSFGNDFHAYHNEHHVLEICDQRIDRLADAIGFDALRPKDWCALMLFGAGHDLRQREAPGTVAGVGANERASIEETHRILDATGFSRERDAETYLMLELMIAGSTFDARPPPGGAFYNAADLVQSGGALAAKLDASLDAVRPGWRHDPAIVGAHGLALIAADLDTANVAEPFDVFATTGENLCREREMLSGRSLAAAESALPVLSFLTSGQDRFFFELHRFQSEQGRAAFAPGKQANAPRLKALVAGLRARIALQGMPETGARVLDAYHASVEGILDAI